METNIQIREVQVSYSSQRGKLFQVKSADDAFEYFSQVWDKDTIGLHEEFRILLLNRANRVLGCFKVSQGGLTSTIVNMRIVFGTAVKALATSIILAHNHPSNNMQPSVEDKELTQKMNEAVRLLDINVLDHLILGTDNNYLSFSNEGWL